MFLFVRSIESQAPLRGRLAPTPSGFLHRGNALNFVLTWLYVRASGGQLRLRIDDLDTQRVNPAYLEDIFRSLEWLGLDWDLGPEGPDEHVRTYSQRIRIPRYEAMLDTLRARGRLFACCCSRNDIRQQSEDGQYPGTCRSLELPFDTGDVSWRVRTPEESPVEFRDAWLGPQQIDLHADMRDFVVRRRDGLPAYQLASLCDDVDFGTNFILRGKDLLASTAAQCFLAEEASMTGFRDLIFCHHPLILDASGQKLSKSAGSTALHAEYSLGRSSEEFYSVLSSQLHFGERALPISCRGAQELLEIYLQSR
jgi:glutamyl/glutaminyl-tRNA synthetase